MTLSKALELVVREFDKAKEQEWIHDPVAWSLYVVWKMADADRREE